MDEFYRAGTAGWAPMRTFEDFRPGQVFFTRQPQVEADEIVAFVREYDPQPFHVHEETAAETVFGG
jgi:acyl dehydratase